MKFILAAAFSVIAIVLPAHAADFERWSCEDKSSKTVWTIAENRMFVAKGRGALQVVSNSSTLVVAYRLSKTKDGVVISYVYMLAKADGKLIVYNDMVASIFKGEHGQPLEPEIATSQCIRIRD